MDELRVVVGVATAGRPEYVSLLVSELERQTRPPDLVIICPTAVSDVDHDRIARASVEIQVLNHDLGLPRQRNAILAKCDYKDILIFFDDDFLPERHYIERCWEIFAQNPSVALLTGTVLVDGINGPGLSPECALRILENSGGAARDELLEVYNAYGCNMALRISAVAKTGLRFDERLPLYGWLEDVDFSRGVAPFGRIVRSTSCRGVHLGAKSGRTAGVRLGYSQLANPIYIARKGRMAWRRAGSQIAKNVLANFLRAFVPEPWVDRRGRLRGNILAALDLLRGKMRPEAILTIR